MEMYCFFIISVIAVVTYSNPVYDTFNNTELSQHSLCATDECINAASEILANLNRSVDPCDNFYKFACGGWIQNNPVNRSFQHVLSTTEIEKNTQNQLREILEEPVKPGDTKSLIKAKHVFAQCMNKENSQEYTNFSAIINKYTGWPWVMSRREWEDENVTWQNVSTALLENGFQNGLFNIRVWMDFKMSNSTVIVISEPTIYSPSSNMMEFINTTAEIEMHASSIVNIIKNFLATNFTKEYGGTVDIENITRNARDIVLFETELDKLKDPDINTVDVDTFYFPRTIQQLQEEYDKQHPGKNAKIDWHLTIQKTFASEGIAIQPSEKLIVAAYKYLTNLVPLLEETPSRTIVNYMQWSLFRELLPYTKQSKTHGVAENVTQRGNDKRWKSCLNTVNLKSAISHEYVKKYESDFNIEEIRDISLDVKDAVREQIRQSTWVDETTKEMCLEKLAYMTYKLIKPDWYSDEAIDRYYESVNVSMGYLENIINIMKFQRKIMLNSLRAPVDKTLWFNEPTIPGASYFHYDNTLVITAALLQKCVYNRSRLPYMNYGSIGYIIGHEINHGFDNMGRKHDKNGNAVQWWTQTSIDAYKNITQCFIDQYNEYLTPGLEDKNIHINGRRTLGENIGDSAGIASAYYAYKNRKARVDEIEVRVPGLEEYSDDQIFFMTFAQTLCQNTLPGILLLDQFINDVHPIDEIRVRGSLSNLREFSEAYNCSAGTPMNPEKKCALWQ